MVAGTRYGAPPEPPADATEQVVRGPGGFVTAVDYRRSDGRTVRWEARAARKAQSAAGRRRGLTWWTGLLFAVGSTCFVVGPVPAYADAVGGELDALTFFIGSLFFTTAGYLTYVEVVRQGGH